MYSQFDNPKDIFSFYSVYCGNRGSLKILAIEKWLLFQELGEIWPHHSFLIKEQADKKDKNINKKNDCLKRMKDEVGNNYDHRLMPLDQSDD